MPYIRRTQRMPIDYSLNPLIELITDELAPLSSGELNYILTKILHAFIKPGLSYSAINTAIGAIECCKLELYRRLAVPYEEGKITENGDV